MATGRVRLSVPVDEPAEAVWEAATDWTRQGEWMTATQVHVISGDGASPGSRLAAFTGLGGVGFLDTMEITEWEPPLRCEVRHIGGLIAGNGGFRVVSSGSRGSTFVWWESLELPAGGGLVWPLIRPGVHWGLRRSLDAFASFAHRRATGASGE